MPTEETQPATVELSRVTLVVEGAAWTEWTVLAPAIALDLWEQHWSSQADLVAVRELAAEIGKRSAADALTLVELLGSIRGRETDWPWLARWVRRVREIDAATSPPAPAAAPRAGG